MKLKNKLKTALKLIKLDSVARQAGPSAIKDMFSSKISSASSIFIIFERFLSGENRDQTVLSK